MGKRVKLEIPKVKEVPVPDIQHPDPPFVMLPKHEFTMGLIGTFIGFI
jgi:hypothetical protein